MIEGEKIILKPITKEYTPLIVKWRNDPIVRSKFIFQDLFTEQSHNEWLDTKVASGQVHQFIIIVKENSRPVGSVYLRDVDMKNEKAEYGIFIGEAAGRGKGYGTEAANLICGYGFNELGLHKIMLRVFADNEAAIRSYEKAGFIKEAYLKDEIKTDEKFRDIVFMARIDNHKTMR